MTGRTEIGMLPPLTSQTLRHICCQTSVDLHVSVVVNRAERRKSSISTTLKYNETVKVCKSGKTIGTEQQKVSKNRKTVEPVGAL